MKNIKEIMSAIAALTYVYEDEVIAYTETMCYEDAYDTDGIIVEVNARNVEDVIGLLDDMGARWFDDYTFLIDEVWGRVEDEA